ncbi:putative ankyrin repeat-containing protein [Aspergillus sclerotioniger CBS 115572]|uniref:Putative ankyrin repeat-containing protein n=1 Tax=Aspergillus sclerotioniger CBS 115572 TaxID=1450535 RepID=A0A317WF79_9EURO|nr:putative ankyrin repeat-containing protein [Aspergillus sclerotioniger CBS 115572]PWY83897.1 putative ankyrin repeat-containing protein [Aspergillus sclerotioniger CBS 115572]
MRNIIKELRITITDNDIVKVLKLFIDRGWNINTDVDTLTPYTFDDITLLRWFLDNDADPNKRCQIRDCTPLSYAVAQAPFEAIDMLFTYGGSVDQGQLLHYTAMRGLPDSVEVLEYIYNKDSDTQGTKINKLLDQDTPEAFAMNYRVGLGTPLHYAALAGSLGSVRYLLEKGGDPWVLDPYRRTALGLAIYANHEHVAQFLTTWSHTATLQQKRTGNVGVVV